MSKRDRTREHVLDTAVALFNTKGYGATAINDIAERAQLTKGSIYGNFDSKQELAEEAFRFGMTRIDTFMRDYMASAPTPLGKLHAMLHFFEEYINCPPVEGGCLLLNTATEADDSNAGLRTLAQRAFGAWRKHVLQLLTEAQKQGQISATHTADDLAEFADFFTASIEGSIMLARLYSDVQRLQRVHRQLHRALDGLASTPNILSAN